MSPFTRTMVVVSVAAMFAGAACGGGDDDATPVATTPETTTDNTLEAVDDVAPEATAAEITEATSSNAGPDGARVALLFVAHGEPARVADGDVPIGFPDGSEFGPHAVTLGTPAEMQHTEWAAAYEEIATAMTYLFPDVNGNEVAHEMEVSPAGDVPPFFTWDAFHDEIGEIYGSFGDFSPHNDLITEHVNALDVRADGAEVVTHLAFLDAVPRIPDVMWEIDQEGEYDEIVVVPMLLASSTHTQEVEALVEETAALAGDAEVSLATPFFEDPGMRAHVKDAVVNMTRELRDVIPADVSDDEIGVLLAAHGTPFVPADPAYGWAEGEIFSDLSLVETVFHDEIAADLPWATRTGRMNYAEPSIDASLAAFEEDGIAHVIVVPSAFPTTAMHTMYDVAEAAIGRTVTPDEGVIVHERPSGMTVYYTADGYADLQVGRDEFRSGLAAIAEGAIATALGSG